MTENYFELQNTVYAALLHKHEQDENFCFTLRKNFSKDTVDNYFTGTEKSNYFSFSMWEIKNGYPGASIDAIVYRVVLRENFFRVSFQLHQTNSPEDKQNELVLNLLRNVYKSLKESPTNNKYKLVDEKPENRMFKVILSTDEIHSKEQLIDELIGIIEYTTPYVDQELQKLIKLHSGFDAQRVTKQSFNKMIHDRIKRTERFKNATPTFEEIVKEVISLNDLEENSTFTFDKIHDGFVWIGDQSGLIGTERAHYEIQFDKGRERSYVLIHFEKDDCHQIKEILGEQLPETLHWYDWHLGTGIRVGGFEMSERPETPNILYEKLKSAEELLGDRIRKALTKISNEMKSTYSLNQILYGPPGTGKTYSTIDKVVEICDSGYRKDNHEHNKRIYDQLVKEGRVQFVSFHQSMAYEDFVEGIKPVKMNEDDEFLKYDVEPGIFKQIANNAKRIKSTINQNAAWDSVDYYKMSIGGKNRPDIHDWCIKNSLVGLGWGGDEDLSGLMNKTNLNGWANYRDSFKHQFSDIANSNRYHIQASFIFGKMKVGDIVVVSKGNHVIDAIGKIVGEYFYDDQTPTDFVHFRKVEWIAKDMDASPEKFIRKQISQQSIYEFFNDDVNKEAFKELTSAAISEDKPYVLVIDEINRGNVSSIFGELISLIEEDKRIGGKNELLAKLPYSKDIFGVPSNLYIIGTMNTADRSVESLDTALRRRFTFEEMLPNPELLTQNVASISLKSLLEAMNQRIEVLVDRDHTIGHAFFMNVNSLDDLRKTFANKVIPLLQEYFYGDYSKMELVIGSAFFKQTDASKVTFAAASENFYPEGKVYHILNIADKDTMSDESFILALQTLIEGKA